MAIIWKKWALPLIAVALVTLTACDALPVSIDLSRSQPVLIPNAPVPTAAPEDIAALEEVPAAALADGEGERFAASAAVQAVEAARETLGDLAAPGNEIAVHLERQTLFTESSGETGRLVCLYSVALYTRGEAAAGGLRLFVSADGELDNGLALEPEMQVWETSFREMQDHFLEQYGDSHPVLQELSTTSLHSSAVGDRP